jgi:hypothetical protein
LAGAIEMDVSVDVGAEPLELLPQPAIRPVKPSNKIAASDLNIGMD